MSGGREPAWRVLTAELRAAVEEERGTGDRAVSYLISPAGARLNRVLIAGTLGPAENIGRDPAQSFWRASLTDPTGAVPVTAGGFQPRAVEVLRGHAEDGPVLVLGKVHLYRGRDGTAQISVRAEEIFPAPAEQVAAVQREAVAQTLDRLEVRGGAPAASDPALPSNWRTGLERAASRYDPIPPARLREMLAPYFGEPATESPSHAPIGIPRPAPAPRSPASGSGVHRTETQAPARARPPGDHAQESILLDIVDELAEGSDDGYADLRDATQMAQARGIIPTRLEELLMRLEEDGVLEEPIVGKVRRA